MDKCHVCKKGIKYNYDTWLCEICGNPHHPKCSGESQEGYGEYPHEDEYSICKKCVKTVKGDSNGN